MGDDIGSGSVTDCLSRLFSDLKGHIQQCRAALQQKSKQTKPEPMSSPINYPFAKLFTYHVGVFFTDEDSFGTLGFYRANIQPEFLSGSCRGSGCPQIHKRSIFWVWCYYQIWRTSGFYWICSNFSSISKKNGHVNVGGIT